MLTKDPHRKGVRVTFELPDIEADAVVLCGDFNGWSREATPLKRRKKKGGWRTKVVLAPGRAYRFRYLVDGERWENDWAADGYVANEHGSEDSVVDLRDPGPPPVDGPELGG